MQRSLRVKKLLMLALCASMSLANDVPPASEKSPIKSATKIILGTIGIPVSVFLAMVGKFNFTYYNKYKDEAEKYNVETSDFKDNMELSNDFFKNTIYNLSGSGLLLFNSLFMIIDGATELADTGDDETEMIGEDQTS